MVFKTLKTDLDSAITGTSKFSNQFAIFGNSLKDILTAWKDSKGSETGIAGIKNSIAGMKNFFATGLTNTDIKMLKNFNTQLAITGDKAKAMELTMTGASKSARELAISADSGGVEIEGLTAAVRTSRIAMVGAKIAAVALQTALTFGLSIALQAAIDGISYLIHYEEKQEEKAKEQAETLRRQAEASKEAANNAAEEADSINELIKKYKQLKSADVIDLESKNEIKNIQQEITKLVGSQADNLNLVNGKLDEELEKLKTISIETAKNNEQIFRTAVNDKISAGFDADQGKSRYEIVADVEKLDDEIRTELIRVVDRSISENGGDDSWRQLMDAQFTYWDNKLNIDFEKIPYIYQNDTINALTNYLKETLPESYDDTDLYKKLSRYQEKLNSYITDTQNVVGQFIANELVRNDYQNESINSYEDFIELYRKVYQHFREDPTILNAAEEGIVDASWVEKQINGYFEKLPQFSNYYQRAYNEYFSEETKKISKIRDSYTVAKNGEIINQELYDWFNSLTQEEKKVINDNFDINNESVWTWGITEFQNALSQWKNLAAREVSNAKKDIDKQQGLFNDLMSEKGTDKNPSFVEGIEKSVEQFQKLEDALVKFESGTLTDKEKISLFKAFPQLTTYANNLGAGIRNLLGGMRGDVVSQFTEKINEFKKAGATEEEISQLEAYERTILNIADSVDSVKNALDSMKSVFKDLDSVIKDYNENQYFSLESLEKLGQNGQRYLSYLSYENGQLKINEEAYKKLVLAQIDEIETKATLQATTDLQSLTDETTAKEYLAKVNIDLAQSQLTAAQAAFQYQLALKLAQGGSVAKAAQKVADNLNSLRNIFASARSQVDNYAAAMLGATSATEKKAKASEKAKSALESEQRALEHSKKALEDEKKALEDTKSEYEKAQKAIEDLIKWTQNYIKQIKEDEVKALQDKKEKFDELIEKQKESLQAEKDLHDYEKSVGEKQNDLASNALKVSVSSLDDSGAGKKAYKQAQEEYKKSQTDMEDFLYDHSIETREKALDQLKEDTDKSYDEQIKTIQDYLSNEVQLYRDACKMIDNDNGTLYGKLLNYCLTYTTTGKKEFDHMWSLAQTAMEKYNVASVGTMQFMDELKGRIYDVDDAIDAVSKNIETYESRISDVKTQLDNLKDAAVEAKNAIDAANSTPLKGDASKSPNSSDNGMRYIGRGYDAARGQYYYKVSYRGRDYWSYVGDSSDTDRVRNLAALGISKEIAKYHSGFDTYGLSQVQHALGVNVKNIGHYASGTRSAKAGVSKINENGLETLMKKTPDGDFVIMNQDDQVYTKKQTDNLYDFASDPEKFLSEKGLSPLSQEELANLGLWGDSSQLGMINSAFGVGGLSGLIEKITGGSGITSSSATTNNIAPVVNITIQGDATQSTVNALHAEAENIVQRARNAAHNDFIETVLKGRKWR